MSGEARSSESIFGEAIEIESPEERAAYLDAACEGDPELRREMGQLVADHFRAGDFLERPAADLAATRDQPPIEAPGVQIGPYKLLQEIGHGGMGVVYMAQQTEPVERRVALKIIKPGMDSRQVIARFEAEEQALAMMDHPNIAKVLDAGTTDSGRPYFVMELVKGLPITDYCDRQHLTPRERLELFVPVCQAVQHAHQKGIIHRDIKPSNVMVAEYDDRPVPKIIDFGVAKAIEQRLTEKTVFTQLGQVVGTIEYMSPEQAKLNQLDIDTRSDIYSLGVLLYELLVGDTPFDRTRLRSAAFDELLRIIREEEPPRPSIRLSTSEMLPSIAANRQVEPKRLRSIVDGELDWIVMKAIEKDRTRRYETASDFAADAQHYLNDEAVVACPPSAAYRFRKFARRNRAAFLSTALVATTLLVAVGGITGAIGWAVRDRAAQRASTEREKADRQQRINTQAELLLADVDRLAQAQQWPDAFAAALRAKDLLATGEANPDTHDQVQQALDDLKFVQELEGARSLKSSWVGSEFDHAGADRAFSSAFLERGIDIENLSTEQPQALLSPQSRIALPLAVAVDEWAASRRHMGQSGWKQLLAVAQMLDPDPLRNHLRSLHGETQTLDSKAELAEMAAENLGDQPAATFALLADSLDDSGLKTEAISVLRQAQQRHPADFWVNFALANKLDWQDDDQNAIRFYSVALGLRPRNQAAWNNLGVALLTQRRLDEASVVLRKAIELDPTFTNARCNLGNLLRLQGKPDEGIDCYRKAIEIDPECGVAYCCLGVALADQGMWREAIACYKKAFSFPSGQGQGIVYVNVGLALSKLQKLDEALDAYDTAIEIDPNSAVAHYYRGNTLIAQQRPDEAIAAYRRCIELDPTHVAAHNHLGNVLSQLQRLDEAIVAYSEAVRLDPKYVPSLVNMGRVFFRLDKLDEAVDACSRAIEYEPRDSKAHEVLGLALSRQGKLDQAINAFREVIDLNPSDTATYFNLGNMLRLRGETGDAINSYRKALQLNPKLVPAYLNLGNVLVEERILDEAIECYRKATELDRTSASAHTGLGNALAGQGKLNEAIESYRTAIRYDPDYAHAHHGLGVALCNQRKLDEGAHAFRTAIRIDPGHAEAYNALAWVLYDQQSIEDAVDCWRTYVKLRPPREAVLAILAWKLATAEKVTLRRPTVALEFALKAVELAPEEASHWGNLGVAQYRCGGFNTAVKTLRKAREMRGGVDSCHQFFLAMACWKSGHEDDALSEYSEALEWLNETERSPEQTRLQEEAEALIGAERIREYFSADNVKEADR